MGTLTETATLEKPEAFLDQDKTGIALGERSINVPFEATDLPLPLGDP